MKLVQGISVFVLAAGGLIAQTATPPPQVATTGLVGLAQEQRAQFNVLNPRGSRVLKWALYFPCSCIRAD